MRPQRVPPGCLLITARVHRRSEAGPQEVGAAGRPSSRAGVNAGPAWERAQGNGGQVRRDTPDRVPDPEGASRENR